MNDKKAYLVLSDGAVFEGAAFGAPAESVGELVFTTGMCGYIETLTDPSYAGQIVMQTFPLIGNYGVIEEDFEGKCAVKGYVVREYCAHPSNFRCDYDLDAFLRARGVPGICGVDTRALTRLIREKGVMNAMVIGSGPIRIGQGIEFDYSSVHCVWTLRALGYDVVIVNNNPETVSTDYDTADRLYFEPLCPEDVMNIIRVEKPVGVVVAFGGQTAIKLTKFLDENGIKILGTSAEGIDIAEDRARFDALLEKLGVSRPRGMGVNTLDEAVKAGRELGYPVLLRPSYVIGGQNMTISRTEEDTEKYMRAILSGGIDNPVLIDKYMPGTELEVDVISDGKDVLIPGIMEHIERAGVHSGDSIAVYPPYNLSDKYLDRVCRVSEKLALALGTKGLVNIQYLIYGGELYVIEVNPRASRTVPYISKVTGVQMVDIASRVMLGEKLADIGCGTGLYRTPPYTAVKVPVFSFEKLSDANSILGPEMKSTGEVLGIGRTLAEALYKGLTAAGFTVPESHGRGEHGVLISVEENDYQEILALSKRFFDIGMKLYATTGTAAAIAKMGIEVTAVANAAENDDIVKLMESGDLSYIVYTGAMKDATMGDYTALHLRAMQLGIPCLTSLDTANALTSMVSAGIKVYLSFQGLPSDGILKTLWNKSCQAAFFLTEDEIKTAPDTVRRIVGTGNSVGIMCVTYDEYESASALLYEAAHTATVLVSAEGSGAAACRTMAGEHGLVYCGYNADGVRDGAGLAYISSVTNTIAWSGGESWARLLCCSATENNLPMLLSYFSSVSWTVRPPDEIKHG